MKLFKYALPLLLIACAAIRAPGLERVGTAEHVHIMTLRNSTSPQYVGRNIFFTYDPETRPVRYVGIAFLHEDFAEVHVMQRNQHGIFFHAQPLARLPEGLARIEYRLVVDGLWQPDPRNPDTQRARSGARLSVFSLRDAPAVARPLPIVGRALVTFVYRGEPNRSVSLAGSFNGWDPFLFPLREQSPGLYTIDVPLIAGVHYYHFWVSGMRMPDPANPEQALRSDGMPVSILTIPR